MTLDPGLKSAGLARIEPPAGIAITAALRPGLPPAIGLAMEMRQRTACLSSPRQNEFALTTHTTGYNNKLPPAIVYAATPKQFWRLRNQRGWFTLRGRTVFATAPEAKVIGRVLAAAGSAGAGPF